MRSHRPNPVPRWSPVLLLAMAALLSGGCATATRYDVKIDAASNPAAADGFSYAMATRDPGRSTDSRYGAVVEHVHTALASRGMYEAPDPSKADVIIDLDYGELPPQSKVTTVTQPVMVNPSSTMGGGYPGTYPGSSYPGSSYPGSNIDPITGQPRSSVVMVPVQRVTYTTEKYIRIRANENPRLKRSGTGGAQMVWTVEATLEDETTDFDAALPAMIDAAIEYIGQNTGGQVKVKVQLPSS